jgi:hypothetical protein
VKLTDPNAKPADPHAPRPKPTPEERRARLQQQAADGIVAMNEYRERELAQRKNMKRLRALRTESMK